MAKYSVHQQPVETLLTWIKSGEIAIPEIQRPFVWKAVKVRDLMDSLYKGYPVGYIITWKSPNVKLRDGTSSRSKKILIDGQQRITALTAGIVGQRVLDKNYKEVRIKIAFNPLLEKFEVFNNAIGKSTDWIDDISPIVNDQISITKSIRAFLEINPGVNEDLVESRIEQLKKIKNKQIGIIELDHTLDIDTVTEIFIRINSKGVVLSNADFVMSKIAADEAHGGNLMRKCIDYFCRLIEDPPFKRHVNDNDKTFAVHEYWQKIKWIANKPDNLYRPTYSDVLRVAYTSQFNRGKFSDLVALLSGRNFKERTYENEIAEKSYLKLEQGLKTCLNQVNYERFLMLLKSAGFVRKKLIQSKSSLNFAYILFLKLHADGKTQAEYEQYTKKWLVLSLLTGRYSGSAESVMDDDIKNINEKGIEAYLEIQEQSVLSEGFWQVGLSDKLETSSTTNNAFLVYLAAQSYFQYEAFLSKDTSIRSLLEQRGDMHHIFPKNYLKSKGYPQKKYNQVANYVFIHQATNIAIKDKAPKDYMHQVQVQIDKGGIELGTIDNLAQLNQNRLDNDIPDLVLNATDEDYETFLTLRRKAMAEKIKAYYEKL